MILYSIHELIQPFSHKVIMENLDRLLGTIDDLLGPNGCAWDKKQTQFRTPESSKDQEEAFGHQLLQLLLNAYTQDIDADNALRKALAGHERKFQEAQKLVS